MSRSDIEEVLKTHDKVSSITKTQPRIKFTLAFGSASLPTDLARKLDEASESETILRHSKNTDQWSISPIDGGLLQ